MVFTVNLGQSCEPTFYILKKFSSPLLLKFPAAEQVSLFILKVTFLLQKREEWLHFLFQGASETLRHLPIKGTCLRGG